MELGEGESGREVGSGSTGKELVSGMKITSTSGERDGEEDDKVDVEV